MSFANFIDKKKFIKTLNLRTFTFISKKRHPNAQKWVLNTISRYNFNLLAKINFKFKLNRLFVWFIRDHDKNVSVLLTLENLKINSYNIFQRKWAQRLHFAFKFGLEPRLKLEHMYLEWMDLAFEYSERERWLVLWSFIN